ncbi:MAG: iron ABC transporter permease [Clostridia bacterium]|nr:iron ABC transporter permease [Clostridia bacterium]
MKHKKNRIQKAGGGALLLLLILCGFLALFLGSAKLTPSDFWAGLTHPETTEGIILYHLRLPRILGAVLAGAGLSLAGMLLQTVTGNDLAGPNIIGVNAGAGFAAILTLSLAPTAVLLLPVSAFAGAFLTTLLIVGIASRMGRSKATVILAGVAVTALLNAGISLLSLLDTDVLASYNHFSIGGLAGVTLKELPLPALLIFACLALSLLLAKRMEALTLGDAIAASLGIRVKPFRIFCLVLASASAAAAVSFAGLLGFVGLIVPHMARRMVKGLRLQLMYSALLGGILVLVADLLGRVLIAPSEIPVGILLAALGAPFFFYLLVRRNAHEI